jgi:hypothetical protein
MYDFRTKEVDCIVWHKVEGSRGANRNGSCLTKYIDDKANLIPVTKWRLYCTPVIIEEKISTQ